MFYTQRVTPKIYPLYSPVSGKILSHFPTKNKPPAILGHLFAGGKSND